MARIRNGFEGGSDGTTITTGNSGGASGDAFSSVSGSPAYDDDSPAPLVGALSSFFSVASGSTSTIRLDWSSAKTTNYVRFYMYKTGNPTTTTTIGRLFDSGTGGVDARVNASGAIVLRNAGGSAILTSSNLANDALHRIEFRIVHSDTVGRMMMRIYSGANAHGVTPNLEYGDVVTDRDTNSRADNYRFGINTDPSTGGWSIYIDEVELDDTDWVGPADRPLAISDLAGTAGNAQVALTHSAASSVEAPITDYVFQYASSFTASVYGTSTTEGGTSLGSSNAQPLPSSAASGDLIVAIIGHDGPTTTPISVSAGWTPLAPVTRGNALIKSLIAARVLDGTTGDNILSVSGAAQDYAVALLRFPSGQHGCTNGNLANDLAYGYAQSDTGNADPPSVDAGYSADRVWVTAAIVDATTTTTVSGVPTNYTSRENITSASSTTSVVVCAATRDLSATQTEDPGAFTNSSRNWIAYTIAIPPAGWTTFSDGTSTSTGTTVTSLSNGTAYSFRVAGASALGQGAWSNVAGPYTPTGGGGSVSATADGSWGAQTATAAATVEHPATAAGAWGSLAATATAAREVSATAAGTWGAQTATVSATVEHSAIAAGAWGSLTATASAARETTATAAGAWGAATQTAAATVEHPATAAGAWGAWSATAAATPSTPTGEVFATADGTWGAVSATASATRATTATAAGAWGAWSATSTATVEHTATGLGTWGAQAAAAVATVEHLAVGAGTWGAWSAAASATSTGAGVTEPWLHGMRPINGQSGGVLVGATATPIQGNAPTAIVGNDRAAIIGRTPATISGGPS